jgi:hypothetical protein
VFNRLVFTVAFVLLIAALVPAANSASYQMAAQVVDAGGIKGTSASYQLLGKARHYYPQTPSSSNFTIGEGFLKSSYYAKVIFAPIVTAIDPSTAVNTGSVSVTISGANFVAGATAKLSLSGEADIIGINVAVTGSGKITCAFDITGAKGGLWNVTVTNPDGRSGTLPSAFKITYAAPTVTAITPDKGYNNEIVNITNLAGNYFRAGAIAKLSKSGETDIMGENAVVESSTRITCRFNLIGKTVGYWDVSVTNSDGQTGSLPQGFKIESPELQIIGEVTNEPNPFNPAVRATVIRYTLSKDADINLYIFNIRGERVWQYTAPAGSEGGKVGANEVLWNGLTAFRAVAGTGVYIVHLTTTVDGQIKTLGKRKIAIIK